MIHAARARVLALLLLPPAATAGATAAAGKGGPAPVPGVESAAERRAIRGAPLDEGTESPELGELRRFEEQVFPRAAGAGVPAGAADADAVSGASAPGAAPRFDGILPGRWSGTGDVPEAMRSPGTTLGQPRQPPPAPDSEWLRALKLPEIPVRWDPRVLRYLDYFRTDARGRAVMASWLRRAGRFRSLFEATLERHGLPKDLVYLAMIESGFETGARSRVGAGGVWQFMPGAARAYGLEVGYWVDARRDPERSAEAAARHLKDLYVRFGSWHLVFAAYNAGYGGVLRAITRYNTNDFWELVQHEAGLPWESSIYVPKILAAAIVGHNLEAFGFADVTPDPPFTFEEVEVAPGTQLTALAGAAKTRPEVVSALNPHLIRERTPPDRGPTQVRVPVGTSALVIAALNRWKGAADERLETVTLRFGERLEDVAKARGTSVRELRRLNGVKDSGEVRAGLTILVPRRKGAPAAEGNGGGATAVAVAAPGRSAGGGDGGGGDDDSEILVAVPDRTFNYEGRERVFYRACDGDRLDEIAETFGVRADDLCEWNNLDPGARLHPGMVMQLYVRKDFDPTHVVLLDTAKVRVVTLGSKEFLELEAARRGKKRLVIDVKAGDTLAKIGRRYGLTLGDLARINRFSYNTELRDGQKVVVYSPTGESPREVAHGLAPDPRRAHGTPVSALARGSAPKGAGAATAKSPAAKDAPAPAAKEKAKPAKTDTAKDPPKSSAKSGAKEATREATTKAPAAARPAVAKKK